MKRSQKEDVVARLHERFRTATVSVLTHYSGMQVGEIQTVQNALRKSHGTFKVVKNRLAMKAAVGTPLEKVKPHFKGSIALVIGHQDAVLPIKTLNDLIKDQPKLKITIGVLEGQIIDQAGLQAVAKLPNRQEMIAKFAMGMKSPLYGLRGVLGGVLNKWVYLLQAIKTLRSTGG